MSRATKEARTKIACAVGALIVIKDNDLATKEIREKLYQGIILGCHVLQNYPDTGDPRKNDQWSKHVIRSLDPHIDELGIYTYKTLIWFTHLVLTDIMDVLRNRETKALIFPLHELVIEISRDVLEGHIDVFYDKANTLVYKLYQYLGEHHGKE